MLEACEEAIREKRNYDVVHPIRQPDGSFQWMRSSGEPVLDGGGKFKEWLGISVDLERGTGRFGNRRVIGAQISAARWLLRWSVRDLAGVAGASRATIRRLEEVDGSSSDDEAALFSIEAALSEAGAEFFFTDTGKPGVRPH